MTTLGALRASRDFVTRMDTPSRSEQATVADILDAAIAAEEARLSPLGHAHVPCLKIGDARIDDEACRRGLCHAPDCGQPKAAHEAQPRPISKELRAAAERAVEAQANDTRTLDQKIADGVAFIVDGPSDRDLQPFSAQPRSAQPLAWAVKCANGRIHSHTPDSELLVGTGAEAAIWTGDQNHFSTACGPHTAVPLVEQGSDAGLRERLRVLLADLEVGERPLGERWILERVAALLEQAPSAPAPAAPTEREAALVAALRSLLTWTKEHRRLDADAGHNWRHEGAAMVPTTDLGRFVQGMIDESDAALAAYEEPRT